MYVTARNGVYSGASGLRWATTISSRVLSSEAASLEETRRQYGTTTATTVLKQNARKRPSGQSHWH